MKPIRVTALTALLALAPLPTLAALSPFYDSAEQIETILSSSEVADALHQAPLRGVENTGTRADGANVRRSGRRSATSSSPSSPSRPRAPA